MPGVIALGNTQYVGITGTTPVQVTFTPNISNTFRIVNQSLTDTLYVAVYNSSTLASAFALPNGLNPSVPGLVAIAPDSNENVSGNFGAQNTNTIYVCLVADASDSFDCVVTPIRD
jgi:hypothetical protein